MLLKMKTTMASPEFAVQAGDTWECPDDGLAHQLIDAGNAEEYQAAEVVEMVSTFHGGLKAANRPIDELTGEVPPDPVMSTAKEAAQVAYPYDRRTADEIAADAKLSATGAVTATGPLPEKSSNRRAAEEVEAKLSQARAAVVAPKPSAPTPAPTLAPAAPAPAAPVAPRPAPKPAPAPTPAVEPKKP